MPQAQTVAIPKRWPLALSPDNRGTSTTKDAKLINAFLERDALTGDYWLFKRPGLLTYSQPSGGAANGLGCYNWRGNIYSIFGSTIYKDTTNIGTVDTTNGVYAFSESSGGTPRMVLGNGVKAYTYDGTTFAQITDGDFPAAFLKGWAYLDKTTYVMYLPNNILGSDLDNPTSWDPLNLINAQIRPDLGVGLAQHLVYVIGFKVESTEFFFDAANSTGSPLSTVQGAKVNWGCLSMGTVQDIDGILIWAAANKETSPQFVALTSGKAEVISTPPIERLINTVDFTASYSWAFKEWGHTFYGVTFANNNLTLVYDMKEHQWAQWQDTDGNFFPIVSSTKGAATTHIFQHKTNGKLYLTDGSYGTDDGSFFTMDATTPSFDAGTRRSKYLGMIYFNGDIVPANLQVRHTDDDFETWSNFRTVDMALNNPKLRVNSSFFQRAYNLRYRGPSAMRLQSMDLQMDIGTL